MLRVLIVEDEQALCGLLKRTLERRGHAVSAAGSSREAERLAGGAVPFDVVFADLTLPDEPGDVLLERILTAMPSARGILSSGYSYALGDLPSVLRDRVRFLPKPFPPKQLVDLVEASKNSDS